MTKTRKSRLQSPWFYAALGGVIFILFFYVAYAQIEPDYFQLRDDGVITLSHAKNWIDYGFIGVNPSGERLEGYSAPIQFFLFAIAYLLTGISYAPFIFWQTLICTFLLGVFFTLYFVDRPNFSIVASIVTAFGLSLCTAFIEWHGSGMENSITHVLLAGAVYCLYRFAKDRRIQFSWTIIFFLASISRLDGLYHVLPILIFFAIYWSIFEKNAKGVYLVILFAVIWLLYQAWRYWYFGSLASNTLLAQHLNLEGRLEAIFTLQRWYFIDSLRLAKLIFINHAGYLLLLILPIACLSSWTRARAVLFGLSLLLILTACLNPLFFGETRLDPTRSTTQMAFFIFVALFCVMQGLKRIWLYPIILIGALLFLRWMQLPSYYLCCGVSSFSPIGQEVADISRQENLNRPSFANPDLGMMSWYKRFNLVDLGMLGSPMFARLRQGPVLADYFFDFVAPDLIESHETWSCQYWQTLFSDPRFRERYLPIRETTVYYGSCKDKPLPKGIWIRRDIKKGAFTAERELIDDLQKNLSLDRLAKELSNCQRKSTDDRACTYVARTAYRFLPEYRRAGQVDHLKKIFEQSRTNIFDHYLLSGYQNAQAYQPALQWLLKRYINQLNLAGLDVQNTQEKKNNWIVGLDGNFLILLNVNCSSEELKNPFFVRYQSIEHISGHENVSGYKKSFDFLQKGLHAGKTCFASIEIDKPLQQIEAVGQWIPRENRIIWSASPLNIASRNGSR